MTLASALYAGTVRHRRLAPVAHAFRYRLFHVYLDLAELDRVFARRWLWSTRRPALARFRREDHFGDPALPLDETVRALVAERLGRAPQGPVRLLTHLRYFGFVFNPVSFFFCFAPDGATLEAVVAEVDNTPWGERHCYVLDARRARRRGALLAIEGRKELHVSPFMDMDVDYRWHFSLPGERLFVHVENRDASGRFFDATLALRRRPIDGRSLAGALAGYPAMTAVVVAAIYAEAARLWWKRAPFFPHPKQRPLAAARQRH